MTQITITRGHGPNGPIMNIMPPADNHLSRKLTGTKSESGAGIFDSSGKIEFNFGNKTKSFNFEKLDWKTDSPAELMRKINARITAVRTWVASETYSEIFTITLD